MVLFYYYQVYDSQVRIREGCTESESGYQIKLGHQKYFCFIIFICFLVVGFFFVFMFKLALNFCVTFY